MAVQRRAPAKYLRQGGKAGCSEKLRPWILSAAIIVLVSGIGAAVGGYWQLAGLEAVVFVVLAGLYVALRRPNKQ